MSHIQGTQSTARVRCNTCFCLPPTLAFLARVGNNPVGPVMRLACGLAIALWLSFPAEGMVRQQQDLADAANSTGQTHAPPATPEEKAPVDVTPAPEKKAPNSASKEKQDATSAKTGSASRATKRRKRSAPDGGPRKVVVREGGAREPGKSLVI